MMCYNCWRCDGDINDDNKTERKKRIHGSQAKRRKNTQGTQFDLKCAMMAFLALMITSFHIALECMDFCRNCIHIVFIAKINAYSRIDRQKAEKELNTIILAGWQWHKDGKREKKITTHWLLVGSIALRAI